MRTTKNFKADVAIVGGGPTGLTLAVELRLGGLEVIVLERREKPVAQARALSMQPRSVEVYAMRGLAGRLIDSSNRVPTGHYSGLPNRLDYTKLDTTFPFTVLIPQTRTEVILETCAKELGADIRRGFQVEAVENDDAGVKLSGKGPEGAFTCEASYVVGCDGARSLVRAQAGIAFVGCENDRTLYFGDVRVTSGPESRRFQIENDAGFVEGFPIEDGKVRLVFSDSTRFSVATSEPVTLEEMQDGARRIMGPNVVLSDPSWMSRFGNESKLAERYRSGRFFLAGDSSHIHMPAGGQGMNTGIQDAMNLGWKLAGVLRGAAPETILDSYERERRPVGQLLIDNTLAQGQLVGFATPAERALRRAVNDMLGEPALNRRIAGMISGIDLFYPEPLFEGYDAGASEWTGRRLADVGLRLADGTEASLFSLLQKASWIDLQFDGACSTLPAGISPDWVHTVRAELLDRDVPMGRLRTVLVRPDGHVAFARTT